MIKTVLIFAFFISLVYSGTTYTYNPVGGNNLWSNNLNWNPNGVPAGGDVAVVGQTVVLNSFSGLLQELVLNGGTFYLTEGVTLQTTNISSTGTPTVYVAAGSTLTVNEYWNFNGGSLSFQNFGSVTLNPRFVGTTIFSNTGNNTVNFGGALRNIINVDVVLPSGFSFSQIPIQRFISESIFANKITFNYRETVSSQGWILDNNNNSPDLTFNNGVIIAGAITSTNSSLSKDTVTFSSTVTINANTLWDVEPIFSGNNGVFLEGTNTLTFQDKNLIIDTPLVGGSASVVLNQQQQTNPFQTLTLNRNVVVSNNNLNFVGNWRFTSSGNSLNFTTAGKSVNQNYTADNTVVSFAASTTLGIPQPSSLNLQTINGGRWLFLDSLNVAQTFTWTFEVGFYCSLPARTFSLSGSSQNFNGGIRIYGCTLTSSSQNSVQGSVTTEGGNSTLPNSSLITFPESITFSGASQLSITLSSAVGGGWNIPSSKVWTILTLELIITGTLNMDIDSSASGNGMLTVTGNAVTFSQNVVSCLLSFYSGTVTLTGTNRVSLNGGIYLRNTILTGQANIWLGSSNIYLTKGLSTIDNAQFKFKSGITTFLYFDGIGTNPGAQLDITGSGNTNRIIENSVNAQQKVNIVFRDTIQFNTTLLLSTSFDSSVTFMQIGTSIVGGHDINFGGNFYFNGTTTTLTGQGSYNFNTLSNLYLTGSLNVNGVSNNLAPVYLAGNNGIGVVNDLTIGSVVVLQGVVTFMDNDNVQTTATTTATLQNDRSVFGAWTLGSNVIVTGNLIIRTPTIPNSPGYLQINGNQITLSNTFTTNNRIILTNPATLRSLDGNSYTISLGDFNSTASPFYPSHGLTLPALTVENGITLSLISGLSAVQNVAFNGNIGGSGFLSLNDIVGSTTNAITFSTLSVSIARSTFVGSGSYLIFPTNGILSFTTYAYAETTVNVNASNINANTVDIRGFLFTVNPTNFLTGSYNFRDARTVGVNYVANVPLTFHNDVTLNGSISGSGLITFRGGVILAASQSITTNPVTFGASSTSLNVVSGAFTLSLSGTTVNVVGRVVSGGVNTLIVSSSPSSNAYIHTIIGGGVIPSAWTWSNTIKFGTLNVTGARTISFPLQLTNGQATTFNDGITFTSTGTFLADPIGTSTLAVENGITTNTNTVLPSTVTVTTSGLNTFNFAGTNVLQLNGTFNCGTRLNFATSVTFGYDLNTGTTQNLNLNSGCFFFGTQNLIINRQNIRVLATSPQNIYIEPSLTFGLLPPLSSSLISGTSVLNLRGNIIIQGTTFSVTSPNIYFDAISITTSQNSTLSGLNPNATLTFVSSTNPWVEPQVSFNGVLNQNVILNGPIRLVNPSLGPSANFVGPNRVAFVNQITLSSSAYTFTFSAPIQLYVNSPLTDFIITAGTNTFLFNQVPSLFNPLGLGAPNLRIQGTTPTVRFSFNGAVTFGNVWVEATNTATLRLSSGVTFNAATLTVNTGNVLWVDNANVNLENLFFSQTVTGTSSTFVYTVSSATPPTVTVSKFTFYQGNAVVVVNNFVWSGAAVTAISSTNSNTAGQFLSISGSPGYTFSQTKAGNNLQFSATQNPTIVPFPTQSNGPSPIVSSASFTLINIAFLLTILFFIF